MGTVTLKDDLLATRYEAS